MISDDSFEDDDQDSDYPPENVELDDSNDEVMESELSDEVVDESKEDIESHRNNEGTLKTKKERKVARKNKCDKVMFCVNKNSTILST